MSFKKEIKKLNKQIDGIGEGVQSNIQGVENWVVARRKFLIKLTFVVGFIAVLLIFSHVYLRVAGVGI